MYLWQGDQEHISKDISQRPKSNPGEGVREQAEALRGDGPDMFESLWPEGMKTRKNSRKWHKEIIRALPTW